MLVGLVGSVGLVVCVFVSFAWVFGQAATHSNVNLQPLYSNVLASKGIYDYWTYLFFAGGLSKWKMTINNMAECTQAQQEHAALRSQ